MCYMIGAKLVAHERSRTDGSTSTSDDLKGLDVSSFYLRSGRGSQQGQRRFGVHASAEDRSTGLQQTCVDGLTDARQFVDKKCTSRTTCQVAATSPEASSKRCLMASVLERVMAARALARAAWKACLSVADCDRR